MSTTTELISQTTASPLVSELGTLTLGIGGARRNAAAALASDGTLLAFCEEERVTRVRRAGLNSGVLPEHALSAVLHSARRQRDDIVMYAAGEDDVYLPGPAGSQRFPHHVAHALTGYLTSSFPDTAILVCDGSGEEISVWRGRRGDVASCDWPRSSKGLAAIYSQCAALFSLARQEHRLEGLARLDVSPGDGRLSRFFSYVDGRIVVDPGWKEFVRDWLATDGLPWSISHGAHVAASFQREIGRLLLELIADIRRDVGTTNLCLCGGLFFNTFFNTLVSESKIFENTFVAPNPGNTGIAAGAALAASGARHKESHEVSPFLGPFFDSEEIKSTLDNCKLSYAYLREGEVIDQVVSALAKGHLVGWFQGQMEWGHRALGNRSILANPQSPHVIENLNVFLKHRPMHTAYGLSVCEDDAHREFRGPQRSRWMEYDFDVVNRDHFRHVLPEGAQTLRVQTIDDRATMFNRVHKSFAAVTGGTGVLINTSFNGFSEPIVSSPRDAIRVFFGTGLDLLAIGRFILRK